ncbi:UBX domain protein Ubx2 [Saitoella coloradoensis]
MDDQEAIAQFCAITDAKPATAEQYLRVSDGNIESAVMLFFESGGADLNTEPSSHTGTGGRESPVQIPDEDDFEDDEAMARRLAAEYGNQEVRAPIAPTTQTLVEPEYGGMMPGMGYGAEMFPSLSGRSSRPGIFNQQRSVWDAEGNEEEDTTGGAAEASSKASRLAKMFRPPFDIMTNLDLDSARDQGKEELKWLMVNIQDLTDFSCQCLNRDLWSNNAVKDVIRENFLFMQYNKDGQDGQRFGAIYSARKYPHIAILDPRTGEQVKVWSEMMTATDFLMQVHEFLDRFSLDIKAKNPIAKKAKTKRDPSLMTEEEQMNAALSASMKHPTEAMTPDVEYTDPMEMEAAEAPAAETAAEPASPFDAIKPVSRPEPTDPKTTTRIQLRLPDGRKIRRFNLDDPVQAVFEYIKAEVDGAGSKTFDLTFNRMKLIEHLDETIEAAGLKNATVIMEFTQ